jgi:hypothetical protein
MIVIMTLCAALVADWAGAPLWLPYGLAIIVGSLALVVMASRDRRGPIRTDEGPDATGNSWIAHELAGKGSPPGFYVLGFFGLITIILTGFQGPYSMPAWAALALGVAWGIANARYPDEKSEP